MSASGASSPAENLAFIRQMIPAMNRSERAGLLGGVKSGAPVRPTLSPEDLAHLEALGLAA